MNAPKNCEVCGKVEELRPYGKNGAWVCFACGMGDEEEAKRQFSQRLGDGPLIVVSDDVVALSKIVPPGNIHVVRPTEPPKDQS